MRDTDELGMPSRCSGLGVRGLEHLISRELQWSVDLSDITQQKRNIIVHRAVLVRVILCGGEHKANRQKYIYSGYVYANVCCVFSVCLYDEEVGCFGRNNKYI